MKLDPLTHARTHPPRFYSKTARHYMAGTGFLERLRRAKTRERLAATHRQACPKLLGAFPLLELLGVLAILAIIASLLLPRILNSRGTEQVVQGVNRARVEEALMAVRGVKTAAAGHYARFGSLASRNGVAFQVPATYENYDAILLSEQLLDRPFAVRLGKSAVVRLVNVSGRSTYLLEVVISGVTEAEAKALNDAMDGPALGANPGEDDQRGEVTYRRIQPGEPGVVHIYITQH